MGFDEVSNLASLSELARVTHLSPDLLKAQGRMRIMLFQPPVVGGVKSLLPQVDENSEGIGFKPPLGLIYLATTLKVLGGHEVKVVDCLAQRLSIENAVQRARDYEPDLIGISGWTDFWYPAYKLGEALKAWLPEVHLVYGGPHVSIFPEATLAVPFVDSIIVGDGEIPLLCLANMLTQGRLKPGVPGLYCKNPEELNPEEPIFIMQNLDLLPIPDHNILPLRLYSSVLSKGSQVTTMITSRGCPHRCIFCKLHFQKTVCRSSESVVEEFRQIQELGIKEVEVYDDTFTWSKSRVVEICNSLIKSGNTVNWAIRDRVDKADPRLLELLYRAGCTRVHYGVESGVDRVLKRMRKGITTQQARRAVALAKETGMTVLTYFMFGNLDESVEDMQRTIDFALELDADYSEFSITIPYPGTELYNTALQSGLISHDFWREHAQKPVKHFQIPQVIENHADLPALIKIRNQALRRFYFRPRYLWRQLKNVDNFQQIVKQSRLGGQLLKKIILDRMP